MAVSRPRRAAPFGAARSARPLLSADGVYSVGRNEERFLKEGLGEDCHKRDGERLAKKRLNKGAEKRDGEGF